VAGREYSLELVRQYPTVALMYEDIGEDLIEIYMPKALNENYLDLLFAHRLFSDGEPPTEKEFAPLRQQLEGALRDELALPFPDFLEQVFAVDSCFKWLGPDGLNGWLLVAQWLEQRLLDIPPARWQLALWQQWLEMAPTFGGRAEQLLASDKVSLLCAEQLFLKCEPKMPATLMPPDSALWTVAGGAVLNRLADIESATSDLDIFVYNNNMGAVAQLLNYYDDWSAQRGLRSLVSQVGRVWNLAIEGFSTCVQIVSVSHRNAFEVVLGFDMDAVECFASRETIVASTACLRAIADRTVRRCCSATVRPLRIAKIQDKGFHVVDQPVVILLPNKPPLALSWNDNCCKEQFADYTSSSPEAVYPLKSYRLQAVEPDELEISYFHDRTNEEVRACTLPDNWLELIEIGAETVCRDAPAPKFHMQSITYDGRAIAFELEPRVLADENDEEHPSQNVLLKRSHPTGIMNLARRCDTQRMFELYAWLGAQHPKSNSKFLQLELVGSRWDTRSISDPRFEDDSIFIRAGQTPSMHMFHWTGASLPSSGLYNHLGTRVACRLVANGLVSPGYPKHKHPVCFSLQFSDIGLLVQ